MRHPEGEDKTQAGRQLTALDFYLNISPDSFIIESVLLLREIIFPF